MCFQCSIFAGMKVLIMTNIYPQVNFLVSSKLKHTYPCIHVGTMTFYFQYNVLTTLNIR